MRIRLVELKRIIRSVLKEAGDDRSTVSAQLDPKEKEMASEFPKWGSPRAMKTTTPTQNKATQVKKILLAKGLGKDAGNMNKITNKLHGFIDAMDPGEAMVADADDIAGEFAHKVLGVSGN